MCELKIPTAEYALHDALGYIFSYLNIFDLTRASEVCTSWKDAARLEKSKRGPQILILPATRPENHSAMPQKNLLRVKPKIALLFTDGEYNDEDDAPNRLMLDCEYLRPHNCTASMVAVFELHLNYTRITTEGNEFVALLLPQLPLVKYSVALTSNKIISKYQEDISFLESFAEKLFILEDEKEDHRCFMIFLHHNEGEASSDQSICKNFAENLVNLINTRCKPGSYSLWGGHISDFCAMESPNMNDFEASTLMAISISGPTFRSWSVVIKDDLCPTLVEAELRKFKEGVRLNYTSVALLITPSRNETDQSKITAFKRVFGPSINLITCFNASSYPTFAVNTLKDDKNESLMHVGSCAYLILTYKLR